MRIIEDCNTPDCENKTWQGQFNGNLCKPCYNYYENIIKTKTGYSQACKNHLAECKAMIKSAEIFKVEELYK